ncbi:Ca2+/calmodulin-dependent protein kinase, EF-Hand protein superfamily [Handroanthus impetiginosus]|uniref:non-specific serine/threonine protein kinase n=1 Tax=Handroanthus impetiginosus TaxID=429701 RepID=A0A2G9GFD6_9LAMI|nr:Ca2+/calmodulin-dependent protein kinase, EF-Hand protein superfamily [Handroanthus impetiginosus]
MGHCCSKNVTVSVDKDDFNSTSASANNPRRQTPASGSQTPSASTNGAARTPAQSFTASPWQSPYPAGIAPSPSPARTPGRKFRWPLPPPSPAKPIMSAFLKRQPTAQPTNPIPEEAAGSGRAEGSERQLDKSFGYSKNFAAKYELGKEVGRGHFGHTCWAKGKKGEMKNQQVAVKIISKAKMTTAIAIEDVRREVKILKALSGHRNLIKFYDAFEDAQNVYVVMELCEGGELLDRILARGGRYTEEDAKNIVVQMLSVVAFCHLQGVVHRDLKPENFLFATKDEDASMKVIDFGLSDFIRPDQRLNDIVGSAYYVAPEVLHRSYSCEADIWSIGVITYILLCGSRPFWARTESGIFRSVLRADPNFYDAPWPSVSPEAKDFVKRLLNRDHRKRMSAAQALTHPWLRGMNCTIPLDVLIYKLIKSYIRASPLKRAALKALSKALKEDELIYLRAQFALLEPKDGCVSLDNFKIALMKNATDAMKESRVADILNMVRHFLPTTEWLKGSHPWLRGMNCTIPLDVLIYKLIKSYIRASPLKRAALKALSKALKEDELIYLRAQFALLEPKDGCVSLDNFKIALMKNATDAMKESRVADILNMMESLSYRKMDFEEFCAAAISTYQLEALEKWEEIASTAFQNFEQEGNRVTSVEELAQELNLGPAAYSLLKDWVRPSDGKLSFLGYTKFLHGVTLRNANTRHRQ